MVRTQIRLTEEQARRLKDLARRRDAPLSHLVRESVDLVPKGSAETDPDNLRRRVWMLLGVSILSTKHDKYLAEIEPGLRRTSK